MEHRILQELDAAARVILAPPSMISNQQRSEAEAVFLNFRRTKGPYQICKYIFENSTIDYVIFETSNALKEAIIREWNYMDPEDINSIRNYLLQHVLNTPNIAVFVREKILQVIAVMVKRGSISDMGAERRKLLGQVEQLIMSGELRKQILGCCIICAIMQEYATTKKSADVGLPWETHLNAQRQFELTDLKQIFQLCVTALSDFCKVDSPFTENALLLTKNLLQIAEGTLMWTFISENILPKWMFHMFFEKSSESDFNPSLKLGTEWKDIILAPNLIKLFFHLHWKIRNNANLTHYTLNCLVQLASLDGDVFIMKAPNIDYIKNYIECFVSFLNSVEIVDREAIGISYIFVKLLIFNQYVIVSDLGCEEIVQKFFCHMAQLTCHFAKKAAQQDSRNYDESMFTEAFDNMLKAWNCLFREHCESMFREASHHIFDIYLRCHLSPPYGFRAKLSTEDVDEAEEEDLNKYGSQLQAIAMFARQIPDAALPTLAKLIDEKTYEVRLMWQDASNNNIQRDDLYEDLHWLLMIAGHVLSMEEDGSTNVIPSNIMNYSFRRGQSVNINDSLSLLTMIDRPIMQSDFSRLEESTDHVIWLVSSVFRLSELEKQMGEAKLVHVLSPTLASTIAWFLQTWSHSYLLMRESSYDEVSVAFATAFGEEMNCAKWIVDFILNKIQSNFLLFGADHCVTDNTCKLLISLVSTREKALFVLKNQFFWNIINSGLQSNNRYVSPDVKKMLIKSVTLAVSSFDDHEEKRKEYLNQILKPIIEKLRSIISDENFKQQYHDEMVRSEIIEIFHLLLGVVEGAGAFEGTGSIISKCLFEYLAPALTDTVSLLSIYHNYQQITQSVLELFRECSYHMLCYFSREDAQKFYEICLCLVETYVKHNSGRLTEEVNAEEDSFNDMLIFMDLLRNLLNREIIDDIRVILPASGKPEDVCILGLRGILPLMSVETLKFPTLCSRFYTLLIYLCELHSDKIYAQSREFLVNILAVIELGLTLFGTEITTLCCEFIGTFSKYLCSKVDKQSEKFLLLQPFLKIIITIILSRQINSENIRAFGLALYSLICCYKDCYMQLVEELISSQTDQEIAQRLSKEFTDLTSYLSSPYNKQEKSTFENNFERFVINVQGFLFVK